MPNKKNLRAKSAIQASLDTLKAKNALKADFMEPQVFEATGLRVDTSHGTFYIPELSVDLPKGEGTAVTDPSEIEIVWPEIQDYVDVFSPKDVYEVEEVHGWFGRYSAPGYLDATDYVFAETEAECKAELESVYGMPDMGEEMESQEDKVMGKKATKVKADATDDAKMHLKHTERLSKDANASAKEAQVKLSEDDVKEAAADAKTAEFESQEAKEHAAQAHRSLKSAKKVKADASLAVKADEAGEEDEEEADTASGEQDTLEDAFKRGMSEGGSSEGITYDNDPMSPRSEAYDLGRNVAEGEMTEEEARAELSRLTASKVTAAEENPFEKKDDEAKEERADKAEAKEDKAEKKEDKKEDKKDDETKDKAPKKESKAKVGEIEIVKDGEVIDTFPDAFGDDSVSVIKFFRKLYNIDESDDKKAAAKEKKEGKDEAKLEDKPLALPKVEEPKEKKDELPMAAAQTANFVKVSAADQKNLDEAKAFFEKRITAAREIVAALVDKNHIVAEQRDIDTNLIQGMTFEASVDAALKASADRKFRELLSYPDAELLTLKASLPSLKTKVAAVDIQASKEINGGQSLMELSILASAKVEGQQNAQFSLGAAFGAGLF